MIRLKNMELPLVVQSPMANCTDLAFRLVARAHGMRFAFLEMLSAETLVRNPRAVKDDRLHTVPEDEPLGAQLVGCDPVFMGEAAAKIEAMGFSLVDLNLGCPVPKVVAKGGGSLLLKEPAVCGHIFARVVKALRRVPVTVKMRLGFADESGAEAVQIAKIAEDCGVNALAVHGRTRVQGYSGNANYESIRRVKSAVSIPVFGNGDVVDGASARRLMETSGCDGVMLGRGALGNPWIYREVEAALEGKAQTHPPALEDRKAALLAHIELTCRYELNPIGPLRRIICWYYKEERGAAEFRHKIHSAQSVDEMKALIEAAFRPHPA